MKGEGTVCREEPTTIVCESAGTTCDKGRGYVTVGCKDLPRELGSLDRGRWGRPRLGWYRYPP